MAFRVLTSEFSQETLLTQQEYKHIAHKDISIKDIYVYSKKKKKAGCNN